MDIYNFRSNSDSDDSDFSGFEPEDITSREGQLPENLDDVSSVSSVSSSSSDSDSESSDSDNSLADTNDLHANLPDWTMDFVPIYVPPFNQPSGPDLPNGWDI